MHVCMYVFNGPGAGIYSDLCTGLRTGPSPAPHWAAPAGGGWGGRRAARRDSLAALDPRWRGHRVPMCRPPRRAEGMQGRPSAAAARLSPNLRAQPVPPSGAPWSSSCGPGLAAKGSCRSEGRGGRERGDVVSPRRGLESLPVLPPAAPHAPSRERQSAWHGLEAGHLPRPLGSLDVSCSQGARAAAQQPEGGRGREAWLRPWGQGGGRRPGEGTGHRAGALCAEGETGSWWGNGVRGTGGAEPWGRAAL